MRIRTRWRNFDGSSTTVSQSKLSGIAGARHSLDTVSRGCRHSLSSEINGHDVPSCVRGTARVDNLVERNLRLAIAHVPQCQAALLELRLRVVPILIADEMLQPWEEHNLAEPTTVFQTFVDVQGAKERFEYIGAVFHLQTVRRRRVQ